MGLNQVSIRLCVGSYTDTFQLFKVTPQPHILHCRVLYHSQPQKFPGYHKVDFTPFGREMAEHRISGCYLPIPKDTVVCCSNVRGIGRPSLIDNFCTMFRIHKPNIIVLLETRYGSQTIATLVKQLPGNYNFGFSEPVDGLFGGVVYMWRQDYITVENKLITSSTFRVDTFFQGHPRYKDNAILAGMELTCMEYPSFNGVA